jgi:hypothetical protein
MNLKSQQTLLILTLFSAFMAHAAPNSSNPLNSAGALTNKIHIPVSIFVISTNSSEGRDPFYPESTRFYGGGTNSTPTHEIGAAVLTLQGISGTTNRRLAIVNGRTLAEGEETELLVNGKRLKLRCIEIKNDSASVELEGVRRELKMRGM